MSDPRSTLVGAGYDAMADTWETWSASITNDPRSVWLESLLAVLPADATVVELGCGNGTTETRKLVRRAHLTGVDLSEEQLRRARDRVPDAEFVQGDLTTIEFDQGSLDAVAAFYVFNHVPRELLAELFSRIHGWLRPDGYLLATLGVGDTDGWQGEWLGVPMFFSSYPPETNSQLLRGAGFDLVRDATVAISEPAGPVTFQWVLARR